VRAQASSYPILVTTTAAHGRQTGDRVRLSGIQGASRLNDQEYKVRRDSATVFALFSNDGAARLDDVPISPAVINSATPPQWVETGLARIAVGAIRVTTDGSTTFTPGTTALDASGVAVAYRDLAFEPGVDRP
jgi:hypothetical protein